MNRTLPLAAALLVFPLPARADPALDAAAALHAAGKHTEALAAVDAARAALPPAARLTRWAVSFQGWPVPVAVVGAKTVVIRTEDSRRADPPPPAGPVTGPALGARTGGFDTLVTAFDAATGKRLWTRRVPGFCEVAIDDRTDAVYVWYERLFKLNPATGATEAEVALPEHPNRVQALLIAGRPHFASTRGGTFIPGDAAPRVWSHDVDGGRTAERDLFTVARLSPDERHVLGVRSGTIPGGYGSRFTARHVRTKEPAWTFDHPAAAFNEPVWVGDDPVALLGDYGGHAEVVRLNGDDGNVKWRFPLPRGAYNPGRDQLPGNGYPAANWTAVGMCGEHLLALGGEGALYFLDPATGKLAAKASPVTTHLALPRLVGDAVVVCSTDGIRAIPRDVLLCRRATDEGDYAVLRARCLHALGKAAEAAAELDALAALDPDRPAAWALKAELCRALDRPLDEITARCRHLELTGADTSPELRARWGLVKRIATGNDLLAEPQAAGDAVYAGTAAGRVLKIDARTLAVERADHPGSVAMVWKTEVVKALLYGGEWRDLGDPADAGPETKGVVKGPPAWLTHTGYDGRVVRWNGKHYRPLGGGAVRVLDGDAVREFKPALPPIERWQIHLSPWGPPLGYGHGGVYELDANLCPVRKLIAVPAGLWVEQLAGDAKTLGLMTYRDRAAVVQVWTRDGARLLREEPTRPWAASSFGPDHLVAVGGGYLAAGGEVVWVLAGEGGRVWRFGFGDAPGRGLPLLRYAHVPLFGAPLVRDGLVFVRCRDGAVYVFDLAAVTGR